MRYVQVETITFADVDGVAKPVKDMREIPAYQIVQNLQVSGGVSYDEVASRDEIYGQGNEAVAYKIWEANITALVDLLFDTSQIKKVRIPA